MFANIQAKLKELINIRTEWLFMVTDSNTLDKTPQLSETLEVRDGFNVAFVYNTSTVGLEASTECQVS